jgi:thymidylate synthase (FAD)
MNKINVLDKGYVILHDVMGSDLTIVNAARVSYNKSKEELDLKDEKLIRFLAKHDHTSPFRHATLQFEVYAPLMVARQHWKYVVGSDHVMDAWNESSRRYVTEDPEFYIPKEDEWRSKPENSKQGSGEPITPDKGLYLTKQLINYIKQGEHLYQEAINRGVAVEQARLFLPAYGMYVRYYWTASLQSVSHFLNQRLEEDAQKEIREYAKAIKELAVEKFPVSLNELLKEGD